MNGIIYIIKNTKNNKVYIGKTYNNLTTRFNEHIRDSRKERCENRALYRAIKKHGEDNFYMESLEECEQGLLEDREIFYIKKYDSYNHGYNCTLGGDGKRYIPYSDEQVIAEYANKKSIKNTAKCLKISIDTVSMILHKNNIKIINPKNKKITIVELGTTFDSIIACEKFLLETGKTKATARCSIRNNIKRSIKRNGTYLGYTYLIES